MFAQKLLDCTKCEVFQKSCWRDPITMTGENFNNVMVLLERKAKELTSLNDLFQRHLEEKRELEEAYQRLAESIRSLAGMIEASRQEKE